MSPLEEPDRKSNVKVFTAVSKLVDALRDKLANLPSDKDDEILSVSKLAEIEELKSLCNSNDPLLSLTACQGLVSLVQSNSISLKFAFTTLQGILVGGKTIRGVSSAVLNILVLDLRSQLQGGNVYKNPIPLHKYHPLCRLLIQNPNSWRDMLNQMSSICYHPNKIVSEHSLELLKPLLKFILMESPDAFSETCRHQVWKLLVEKATDSDIEFIFQIVSTKYFQGGARDPLEVACDISILCNVAKSNDLVKTALVPVIASLVHEIIKSCYDPSSILNQLKILLDVPDSSVHTVLIMMSETVTICPAVFLHQLLDFCEWLVNKGQCSSDSVWMLVVASLTWLNCVSHILVPAHNSIKNILVIAQTVISSGNSTQSLIENPFLRYIVSCNWQVSRAIQLARLCESFKLCNDGRINWISNIPTDLISQVYLLIGAQMIGHNDINVKVKAIDVIKNAPAVFASSNLTLFLYQLGREEEPECQLELLRSLVGTAIDKSNISSIIYTLKTLQKSCEPHLQILAVDLYLRLWDIEDRCYPFLLTVLTEDQEQFKNFKFSSQMDIACAAAFRRICEKMPEKHGKELVKPMQSLLIKCQETKGVIPSTFIIEALALLVKARVLSSSSTWRQLYLLTEDMQSAVCVSFCQLVEACLENSCEEDTTNSMFSWLWKLITTHKAAFVINAALRTLKKFAVKSMKLKYIPAVYRQNITLPAKFTKGSSNTNHRPEDVIEFVPGSVWIEFLKNVRNDCCDSACQLLAHWLEVELMNYRGGVYNITYDEPEKYDKLAEYSVCRGLVDYVRRLSNSVTPESDVKIQKMIFQILCFDRSKPLPPIKWHFLLPYIHHPDVKVLVLSLAAKESKGSLSARALIESYINEEPHEKEKELFLYSLLTDLSRGVPPKTLQNLIRRTFRKSFDQNDDSSVKLYANHIAKALSESDIHEANRTMLTQRLKAIWEDLPPESLVTEDIILCAINLPVSHVESMSSVSVMWEVTSDKLEKAIRLRCAMALADNCETPFTWLNECIESVSNQIVEQKFLINEIEKVLEKKVNHESAWPWVEELVVKMLQTVCNNEPGIDFMFSILVLSVDFFSKFSMLFFKERERERLFRFPQALFSLLTKEKTDLNKFAEKMSFILKNGSLSNDHMTALKLGVSAIS